jgi:hypothetical protein
LAAGFAAGAAFFAGAFFKNEKGILLSFLRFG